jgi:hypothetical protein
VRSTLATLELDISAADPIAIEGSGTPGLARYPAVGGAAYALVVDDVRKRFLVGAAGEVTEVLPPLPATQDDHLYPAVASIGGAGGARWATQFVAWNRGTADAAGATVDASVNARVLPTDWIVGLSPTTNYIVGPGKIVAKDDPIADDMGGADTSGALRFAASAATTKFADFYSWIRVYRTREDGGTYGFARNFVKGGQGIVAGEAGFFFTPPDASPRVNAGFLVLEAATGTVTLVGASGEPLATPFPFRWPAGYHAQASRRAASSRSARPSTRFPGTRSTLRSSARRRRRPTSGFTAPSGEGGLSAPPRAPTSSSSTGPRATPRSRSSIAPPASIRRAPPPRRRP